MVGSIIQKEDAALQKSISADQRLVITLCFVAKGEG